MRYSILPYHKNSGPELVKVFLRNVPKFFAPHEASLMQKYLEREGETFNVIRLENRIVGGVGHKVDLETGVGSIVWIFFDPEFHGMGLGRFAVDWCLEKLKADPHCCRIEVRTSQWADKFFERFGFQTFHFGKDYWGEGLDLYHMVLTT